MKTVRIILNAGQGADLGPFTLTANAGSVTPSTVSTMTEMQGTGKLVTLSDNAATTITITSNGVCAGEVIVLTIDATTTTTSTTTASATTTSTTTTTTTSAPGDTTTTTTTSITTTTTDSSTTTSTTTTESSTTTTTTTGASTSTTTSVLAIFEIINTDSDIVINSISCNGINIDGFTSPTAGNTTYASSSQIGTNEVIVNVGSGTSGQRIEVIDCVSTLQCLNYTNGGGHIFELVVTNTSTNVRITISDADCES